MLDALLNLVSAARRARSAHAVLMTWGEHHGLAFEPGKDGACSLAGQWGGRPVRVDLQPTARPYLVGLEIHARCDLGLDPLASVVVMNRALKRSIERWADYLYSQLTNPLQTMADSLPEEVRWLAGFRDAGWPGPDDAFWARYAVLTDAPELARQQIDETVARALMRWRHGTGDDAPLMLMRLRGKLQMRLQLAQPRDTAGETAALDLFALLCQRAALAEGQRIGFSSRA